MHGLASARQISLRLPDAGQDNLAVHGPISARVRAKLDPPVEVLRCGLQVVPLTQAIGQVDEHHADDGQGPPPVVDGNLYRPVKQCLRFVKLAPDRVQRSQSTQSQYGEQQIAGLLADSGGLFKSPDGGPGVSSQQVGHS